MLYTQYRRFFRVDGRGEKEVEPGRLSNTDAGLYGQKEFTEAEAQTWLDKWNREGKPVWRYELLVPISERDEAL